MSRLARFAYGVLAFNILVILGGALVRATGSGAGCGSHWPLCDGEVVPRSPGLETLIEYSHRFTSGIALLLVVALVVLVFRHRAPGDLARHAAVASLVLILVEAAIGAGLVLLELVGDNTSTARAWWMSGHLVNTFLLLGALTLTGWALAGGQRIHLAGRGRAAVLLGLAAAGMLATGASGAVAALGDTIFPAASLAEGLRQDFSASSHTLLRLRVFHPLLAVATVVLLLALPGRLRSHGSSPFGTTVGFLALTQLAVGALNLLLLAPVWMQLIHLLVADLLWIALVLYGAEVLSGARSPARAQADWDLELTAARRLASDGRSEPVSKPALRAPARVPLSR